ncbi:MAG: hypothetical protein AAF191_06780 [Verrucomicrobiota bacterium]
MAEESSEESLQRLAEFQNERLRPDVTGTGECALCVAQRDSLQRPEFALVASCFGDGLLESHLICIDCMEEMSGLVSEQTRNEWNRFVDENFPGVPADFLPAPSGKPNQPLLT